jgi:hypothetical protein
LLSTEWERWRESRWSEVKIFLGVAGAAILAFVIGLLIMVFLVPLVSAANIYEKTLDADNVIFNYEWFKLQYNDYLSLKAKIEIAETEAESYKQNAAQWTDNQRKEYERLASIATGLKYQLQDVISEYNAKSSMLNRNLFKDKELPYRLEVNP